MSTSSNAPKRTSLLEELRKALDSPDKTPSETPSTDDDETLAEAIEEEQNAAQTARHSSEQLSTLSKTSDELKTPIRSSSKTYRSSPLSPLALPAPVLGDPSPFASETVAGKGKNIGSNAASPCSPECSPITSPVRPDSPVDASSPLQHNLDKVAEPRGEKRKRNAANGVSYAEHFEPPYRSATVEEKEAWQGFCEIESEPAIFNLMLREWGVRGVKIQEMFGLDSDSLASLPQPVYGLIFLFQYAEEDVGDQEEACPPHVWFANQVTSNACATVALLNMILNIGEIDLGPQLDRFRNFTLPFAPSLRGEQVANFSFIKRVHNSFARRIDMLEADLALEENFEQGKKKKPARKSISKARSAKKSDVEDSAFHFVAYLPILGELWKLDGLDSTPQKLFTMPRQGDTSSEEATDTSWLDELAPRLQARMISCQDGGIAFNILALVKDPLVGAQKELVRNLRLAKALDEGADEEGGTDKATISIDFAKCGLSEDDVEGSLAAGDRARLKKSSENQADLEDLITRVRREGENHRAMVLLEKSAEDEEDEKAKDKRNDYGPFIQKWLMMLAENNVLRELTGD